jgi:hypothetical protein
VPSAKVSVQSLPQSIPAGLLVTVPEPLPFVVTVRVCGTPTSRSALTAKLVAPIVVPSSLPSWGQEPSSACWERRRSTTSGYQLAVSERSG